MPPVFAPPGPTRRAVLRGAAAATLTSVLGPGLWSGCAALDPPPPAAPPPPAPPGLRALDAAEYRTLAAAAEALLPTEDAKARDGAVVGADRALAAAPASQRAAARRRLAALETRYAPGFSALERAERAAALAALAASEDPERRATYALVKGTLLAAAFSVPEAWVPLGYRGSCPGAA